MKTKLLTALIALLLMSSLASAQSYDIRIASNTNLRAAASLQAPIVERARAGTRLHVTGSFNRWLRIDRNGSESWMADWVRHQRVEDVTPVATESESTTTIDNCCFVDRQCSSNQEWVDGYWAFQNQQCSAPAQSQLPASHGVVIEGSESFVYIIGQALDFLKERAPTWYAYVTTGLDRIREGSQTTQGAVNVYSRTYTAHPDVTIDGTNVWSLAGLVRRMAHEACHVHRYEAGLEHGGLVGERECLIVMIEAHDTVYPGEPQPHLHELLENIEIIEYQWWHN